jgi:hypothetical protein
MNEGSQVHFSWMEDLTVLGTWDKPVLRIYACERHTITMHRSAETILTSSSEREGRRRREDNVIDR